MKKIILLTLAIIIMMPTMAMAAVTKSDNITIHYFTYDAGRDQYILDYTLSGYANAIVTIFITPSGQTYTKKWGAWTVNRRIFHNCNGTFNYNFTVNDQIIGYIYGLETTQIQNNICSQQIPGEDFSDTNPRITDNDDGSKRINYDDWDGGSSGGGGGSGGGSYDLERSTDGGQTWDTIDSNPGSTGGGYQTGYFDVPQAGYYRIIKRNDDGNIVSTDYIGDSEFTGNSSCNGCKALTDMLACPAWDDYVGGLAEAIGGAIPPPPNINDGMDYLIDQLAAQNVTPDEPTPPAPFDPGYPDQETDLPQPINTDVNPSPTDFEPVTEGEGEGAISLIDPTAWQPDNNDIGYNPPSPEPGEGQDYQYTDQPETPPDYDGGDTGETIPDYSYSDTGDEIPDYNQPEPETPPNYQTGDEEQGVIPNYNYQ